MCAARAEKVSDSHQSHYYHIPPYHPIRAPSEIEQRVTASVLEKLSRHSQQLDAQKCFYALSLAGRYILLNIVGAGTSGVGIHAISDEKKCQVVIKVAIGVGANKSLLNEYHHFVIANGIAPDRTAKVLECVENLDLFGCKSGTVCCSRRTALVTEYGGVTLRTRYLSARTPIPVAEFISFARQCVLFWENLDAAGYVLRDIKLENVLINDKQQVRFIDFGAFGKAGDNAPTYATARFYRSPTVLMARLNRAEMPFAFACVFFEILTRHFLFFNKRVYPESDKDTPEIMNAKNTDSTLRHIANVSALIGEPSTSWTQQFIEPARRSVQCLATLTCEKNPEETINPKEEQDEFHRLILNALNPREKYYHLDLEGIEQEVFYDRFVHLIFSLLKYENPPTPQEILAHPFFQLAASEAKEVL